MRETMPDTPMAEQIDLFKLLQAYLAHWKMLICALVIGAAVAGGWTYMMVTPLYRANVTVYVNNIKSNQQIDYISAGNLATAQQLVATYVNIIKSDTVLEKVVREANLDCSAEQLRRMMTAAQVGETELFDVYITHPDPQMAARIANAIATVAPGEIEEFVEGSSTKIIDYAKVPEIRFSPSYRRNVALGGLVALIAVLGVLTLGFLLDVRVHDEQDLLEHFDYPVIGQIPSFEQITSGKGKGRAQTDPYHSADKGGVL